MSKSQFETLFAYHFHMTRQLMECASSLSDAEYRTNPGYGRGSIHELLFHLLRSDRRSRQTLQSNQPADLLKVEDFPTFESLRAGFREEQIAWEEFLSKLSEADIAEAIELTTRRGEKISTHRWRVLEHVVLHGMQHHSELAYLLTARGHSPGNIDFILYNELPAN